MEYVVFLGSVGLVLGVVGVASNPSPYFAVFGLVVAAACGCAVLVSFGVGFLSLVLFLIYLGGMLVVFAYSTAMAAEPFPESWGNLSVIFYVLFYCVALIVGWNLVDGLGVLFVVPGSLVVGCDWGGVSLLYWVGGGLLLFLGWILLLTLFVVLEVIRVAGFGAVCSV
uniref:NADH-ubiquinone oxidoreductase chain 6 n=1 Tax=Luetkenotyphlus brasiliensis TaxID=320582 RepID=W5RHK9_LUEBR|nr:NADH dehydrogenase subunit 6 [Luetkenotyphlus brasiliensis]AGZ19044.1 NADH dehydrogenase subunit 6 [Luetkenotyphlus brasiliensis]